MKTLGGIVTAIFFTGIVLTSCGDDPSLNTPQATIPDSGRDQLQSYCSPYQVRTRIYIIRTSYTDSIAVITDPTC
jgi:hypothetical protein